MPKRKRKPRPFVWAARDEDGTTWYFRLKPHSSGFGWMACGDMTGDMQAGCRDGALLGLKNGECRRVFLVPERRRKR